MRRMLQNLSGSNNSSNLKRLVMAIKRASPDGCVLPRWVCCGPLSTSGSVDGLTVSHQFVSLAKMILTLLLLWKVRPV